MHCELELAAGSSELMSGNWNATKAIALPLLQVRTSSIKHAPLEFGLSTFGLVSEYTVQAIRLVAMEAWQRLHGLYKGNQSAYESQANSRSLS